MPSLKWVCSKVPTYSHTLQRVTRKQLLSCSQPGQHGQPHKEIRRSWASLTALLNPPPSSEGRVPPRSPLPLSSLYTFILSWTRQPGGGGGGGSRGDSFRKVWEQKFISVCPVQILAYQDLGYLNAFSQRVLFLLCLVL